MAGRSFKPASYLAAQPSKRSPRPSFTRSSSGSSVKSDDSFINTLRTLSSADGNSSKRLNKRDSAGSLGSGGASPRCQTPLDNPLSSSFDDTPGRKRSQPIAIEMPSRKTTVYTPLTARGDLPGGYFPNHESLPKTYDPHPFSRFHQENKTSSRRGESTLKPIMSNNSSAFASPLETTPRAPPSIISSPAHELLSMPMGKYHPANYKTSKQPPTSVPVVPTPNISLPSSIPNRKKKGRPTHERHASDVKRKLQEYQMGQVKQAKMLAQAHGGTPSVVKPTSPRLLPLGSPGPITPFELEDNTDAGYLVAGARARSGNLLALGMERGREDLVGQMIRSEQDRRRLLGDEGSRSPVLSV